MGEYSMLCYFCPVQIFKVLVGSLQEDLVEDPAS